MKGMFYKLGDFGYKRSWKEAAGFYIAYLAWVIVIGGVFGGSIATFLADAEGAYQAGRTIGAGVAAVVSVGLSFAVITKKKLFGRIDLVLLAAGGGVLALFGGGLLGLLPTVYLTMLKSGRY